jgi:hypothetical protein
MYYCVFLFQQAGLAGTAASLLANGLQGVVLNLAALPNMYYMDVWGCRRPAIVDGIGMGISMMLIGSAVKRPAGPASAFGRVGHGRPEAGWVDLPN